MKNLTPFVGILGITLFLLAPEISYGQVKVGDLHEGGIVFLVDDTGEHGVLCQTEDLGIMDWNAAMKACKDLGDGWRLPTRDELNLMYTNLHKNKLGGFNNYYWSSTELVFSYVWGQDFGNGSKINYFRGNVRVRAVRAF